MDNTHRNHPTVLIADECVDTRELLKVWLETEGYRVVEAANGEEALKMTRGKCPDLILMATRLPGLDGLEATRRIRENGKECVFPIVCMSTYPTKAAEAQAFAAGCSLFLPKPLDFINLSKLLRRLQSPADNRSPVGVTTA